jgi:hypothetical protein
VPIIGTIGEKYVRDERCYSGPLPPTLAFLPPSKPEHHPAMIAAFGLCDEPEPGVLAAPRDVRAVHLTLLKRDGSGKADVEKPKLIVGSPLGLPIVLAPPNDLLGLAICEGIEDALTAHEATGLGAWAAGSAPFMPKLAGAVPDYIEAITRAARRPRARRRPSCAQGSRGPYRGLVMKEHPDINDTLKAKGLDAVRARSDSAREYKGKSIERRFRLKPFAEIKMTTAPNYLVKGIIPRGGLVVVWGPPKCGKSFWTFDLVMHIALGWSYRGRRVQQGAVVYLALEGGHGFRNRVEAWRRHHLNGHDEPPPFFLCDVPLDVVADHGKLIEAIKAQLGSQMPAAVCIDTLNRGLVGDENKSDDMAKFIRAADAIREAFSCAVIVVHHCGVANNRPRGHTSLSGADDAQIAVDRADDGLVTVKVEHMKDGDASAPMACRLERVELGIDDDGEPITSCIVMPVEGVTASASTAASKLTASQRRFVDILNEAICDVPAEHKTMMHGCTAVSREWLKMCCKKQGWFDSKATDANNRAKLSNMLNALAGKRVIGVSDHWAWLPK